MARPQCDTPLVIIPYDKTLPKCDKTTLGTERLRPGFVFQLFTYRKFGKFSLKLVSFIL